MTKKHVIVHLASCCALCISFILCRFVFYELHHMRDWPYALFAFCLIATTISFFAKARLLGIAASASYTLGFVFAVIFQQDTVGPQPGETGNTLWIIWGLVVFGTVISCALWEIISRRRIKSQVKHNIQIL